MIWWVGLVGFEINSVPLVSLEIGDLPLHAGLAKDS